MANFIDNHSIYERDDYNRIIHDNQKVIIMKFTAEWYKEYYNNSNMYEYTKQQIKDYISYAKSQNIKWIDE